MAIMIPSVSTPKVKSSAERRIFEWFLAAPKTEDWIVLHSLGISNHNRVIFGETDFFVLVPNHGLFALEVKGGRVRRERGIWYFTDKYGHVGQKDRGPFDQARDGAFSIVSSIKTRLDMNYRHLENVFFGYGAMFPDIEYSTMGIEEEQWQVLDCNDGMNVRDYVLRLSAGTRRKWEDHYGLLDANRLPTTDDVRYLAQLLRGDFDRAVSISTQLRYADEALVELTKEQYRCLDQLDDNPRCMIQGGAGTGKTLLALEEAKKAAARGENVALFCFNANLGEWLSSYFSDMPGDLRPAYVGTFHKYMLSVLRKDNVQIQFPEYNEMQDQYFSEELTQAATHALMNSTDRFEKIIVDEAQDLICSPYLDLMDSSLVKGLSRGHWTMFGDFAMQAIFAADQIGHKMIDLVDDRASFIRFRLNINCRNTKPICSEIQTITGYDQPIKLLSNIDGPPVNYITYSNPDEQLIKLDELLLSLLENQVNSDKITILSPVRRENSIVSHVTKFIIKDYGINTRNSITFCTIQAFKGLENTLIILTDIEDYQTEKLMYVGLSRARSGLYILESNKARQEYQQLLKRRFFHE